MKLKLDESGHVVVQDGKPVYVGDDGKDHVYDAPAMRQTLDRLNSDLSGTRKAKDELEAKVKAFEGLDPDAAREALDKIGSIDQKKLIDAGEVEKVKADIAKSYEQKLKEADEARQKIESQLHGEKIGGAFARSKFIGEKLAVPSDMVQAAFGDRFKLEDGEVRAYDKDGNAIYSKSNPGEYADFDEALSVLVEHYPHKDSILKGNGNSGSGAKPGAGGGAGRTVTRSEFESLDPAGKSKLAGEMREGSATLVD